MVQFNCLHQPDTPFLIAFHILEVLERGNLVSAVNFIYDPVFADSELNAANTAAQTP